MISKAVTGKNFGIIVSGGPAPGINSVISSAVIEANNRGYGVKGLCDGFEGLARGTPDAVKDLSTDRVTSIYNTGGSILGTSRFNPLVDPDCKARFISGLREHNIDKLIVIGGDGSAYLSYHLGIEVPDIQIVHVPKTIDNDLILPNKHPSFGFETALSAGTEIIDTLRVDAKTCRRWFMATTMGRKAGFLALGLGMASGATSTIIPEEFAGHSPTAEDVASIIFSSIQKRRNLGKRYGVVIIAEGVLDCLNLEGNELLRQVQRDDLGRIRYSQLELGDVVLPPLRAMLKRAGLDVHINTKNIGYELRCHKPVSFDIEYTKFLGFGAVKFVIEGHSNVMVVRDFDRLGFVPLSEMILADGSVRSRTVDLGSDLYRVARSFMIR